jgi:hypothetical protein
MRSQPGGFLVGPIAIVTSGTALPGSLRKETASMSVKARFTEDRGGLSFGDLKFGLGVVAAFVVAFIVFHKSPPPPTAQELAAQAAAQAAAELVQADPEWTTVCSVAQIYIEDRVKSPGSESFSGCHIVSVSTDKKTVVVAGSVTAANSFNARIRSNYFASIVKKPEALPRNNDFGAYRVSSIAME